MGFLVIDDFSTKWQSDKLIYLSELQYKPVLKIVSHRFDDTITISKKVNVDVKSYDFFGKPVSYTTLRLVSIQIGEFTGDVFIKKEDKELRRWRIQKRQSSESLIDEFGLEGIESFDEVSMTFSMKKFCTITLQKIVVLNRETTYNLKVSLAQLLHKKLKFFAGNTTEDGYDFKDVHAGTPLLIDDEFHVITKLDPIEFSTAFDGKELLKTYPILYPTYVCPPAIFDDLSLTHEITPCFYIVVEVMRVDEATSTVPGKTDSFIVENNEIVRYGYRKSIDSHKINVEIHIYSYLDYMADEMWRFLRQVFDSYSYIDVAGEFAQINDVQFQAMEKDPEQIDNIPHYVFSFSLLLSDNVHERIYIPYKQGKTITYNVEAI